MNPNDRTDGPTDEAIPCRASVLPQTVLAQPLHTLSCICQIGTAVPIARRGNCMIGPSPQKLDYSPSQKKTNISP